MNLNKQALDLQVADRVAIAGRLTALRDSIASAVTEAFLQAHPDWLTRYGDRARQRGIEDARYHIDFLAGAIEGGSPEAFIDYARWTCRVLQARGIAPKFLIENLERIEGALKEKLDPRAYALTSNFLRAGMEHCADAIEMPGANGSGELALTERIFGQAILHGNRRAAADIALTALKDGHSLTQIYVDVLQESLYNVGRLWERNRITVAEEHMATAICQYVIAQLYRAAEIPQPSRGTVVVTGVQGELHQVGANMVSDVLEVEG